ncbi:MAG: DUF1385 domain-containing protein [Fimbriimonadaceae bacterium]|nr:DUF1385 domain-containing protein [Fimbriimonadaceae bacterium]
MPDSETPAPLYGGMAVVEGVMMRSPGYFSVACRAPNGDIVVKTEPAEKSWIGRQKWLMKPFLRGTFAMIDTMAFGIRAMNFAATVQTREDLLPDGEKPSKPTNAKTDAAMIAGTIVVSLLFGFFLFNAVPQFVAEFVTRLFTGDKTVNTHLTLTNYVAEIVKLIFIIGYLWGISFLPAIRDVFRYHGAEHKAINAMEHGVELKSELVQGETRLHPRCGTNFVIIVFVVSFLLQPLIPRDLFVPATSPSWLIAVTRLPVELAMMPIIAGISYELIRAAGRMRNQAWVKFALAPGLATQLITTAEPELRHLDVAIEALVAAKLAEETGDCRNGLKSKGFVEEHPAPVADEETVPIA